MPASRRRSVREGCRSADEPRSCTDRRTGGGPAQEVHRSITGSAQRGGAASPG
ncbi:hypothetical protein Ae406Ps2_2315 [Pseudonocardia sp. Ae406_Ps2]|nr:hypothetical protein Ae406Ps2_2315 [Pseudonocardia sp. Ae406_Ps2]OLM23886.1 hypothetical protein Ae706Ps2_2319 [Pseudonocardia sp. Ae706_Ps2]